LPWLAHFAVEGNPNACPVWKELLFHPCHFVPGQHDGFTAFTAFVHAFRTQLDRTWDRGYQSQVIGKARDKKYRGTTATNHGNIIMRIMLVDSNPENQGHKPNDQKTSDNALK